MRTFPRPGYGETCLFDSTPERAGGCHGCPGWPVGRVARDAPERAPDALRCTTTGSGRRSWWATARGGGRRSSAPRSGWGRARWWPAWPGSPRSNRNPSGTTAAPPSEARAEGEAESFSCSFGDVGTEAEASGEAESSASPGAASETASTGSAGLPGTAGGGAALRLGVPGRHRGVAGEGREGRVGAEFGEAQPAGREHEAGREQHGTASAAPVHGGLAVPPAPRGTGGAPAAGSGVLGRLVRVLGAVLVGLLRAVGVLGPAGPVRLRVRPLVRGLVRLLVVPVRPVGLLVRLPVRVRGRCRSGDGETVGRSSAPGAGQGAVEVPLARGAVVHDAGRLESARVRFQAPL